LFGLFETRSLNNPAIPLTSAALLDVLGGTRVDSGMLVSERSALSMAVVYRCTALISSVAAALPLRTYQSGTKDLVPSRLLEDPHPDYTAYDLWRLSYVHRCLWGNSYFQKQRDSVGRVTALWPLSPDRVAVGRVAPSDGNPWGKVFQYTDEDGTRTALTPREVLHIPGLGYDGVCGVSPVRLAAQAIGIGQAAEAYSAKLFGSGNLLSGILQTEQRLQPADAERLQARWRSMVGGLSRAHDVAVLDSGAKFQSLTMPAADAEMLASREFQVTEIARFYGVPPFLTQEQHRSTSWGTGLEQQAIGWVKFDLHAQWLAPTEQRISKELTLTNVDVKYDIDRLMRGDSVARAQFYNVMRQTGAFSANDIRDLENLPPVEGGDTRLQPLNMAPLGTPPQQMGTTGGHGDGGDGGGFGDGDPGGGGG
jgi:HK97 family phage portal protein